ncbi:hypothetical protein MASR2M29_04190 [Spirochaetota bacterium]
MLLFVDVAMLYLCLFLVLFIRNFAMPDISTFARHAKVFSALFAGWIVIFYLLKLYALDVSFDSIKFARRLMLAIGISGALSITVFYSVPSLSISPKTVLLLFVFLAYWMILAWRRLFVKIMRYSPIKTNLGFIGCVEETAELLDALYAQAHLGFNPVFIYDECCTKDKLEIIDKIDDPAELKGSFDKNTIKLIVLSDKAELSIEARRILFAQIEAGIRFMRFQDFYEMFLRRVPLGVISEAWFLERTDLQAKQFYSAIKRAADISFAFFGLLFTMPFWPLLALSIKLSSKGPVFFKQKRLGKGNKPFVIYKFRTMRVEQNRHEPTSKNDDRITALGAFYRKTRIDEIPQLLNILKGEMSFVGPRPERPELAAELEKAIPFYRQRHMIKPGITGWDQVSGEYHSPSIEDTYKKLQYDLYYLKNMSLALDVSIFFKTIITVLTAAGR